jgi:hypothetical protein
MRNYDVFIFAVYCLSVAYVFAQMRHDVRQYFSIYFQEENLISQLTKQEINSFVSIQFRLADRYKPEQFKEIVLVLKNQSETYSIILDWEQFVFIDLKSKTHRIIRLIPAMNLNLSQRQVNTIVVPQQVLEEKLTIEETLKVQEKGILKIAKPLFDVKSVRQATKQEKSFFLRFVLQITEPKIGASQASLHPLTCEFKIKRTPWGRALRWEGKKRVKK